MFLLAMNHFGLSCPFIMGLCLTGDSGKDALFTLENF